MIDKTIHSVLSFNVSLKNSFKMNMLTNKVILTAFLTINFFCSCFLISNTEANTMRASKKAKSEKTIITCPDPAMIFIPEGDFIMGSDEKEKEFAYDLDGGTTRKYGWYDIEVKKNAYVGDYCIDKTLASNENYMEFIKETKHRFPFISREDYQMQGFLVHPYKEVLPFLWSNQGYPKGLDRHPVVLVSFDDATKYCKWRGNKLKRDFRLPSEEEWEKATRGTDGRYFPWGNEWDPTKLNSWKGGPNFTTEVHKYSNGRSPFGLFDAAGNVFEWTSSTFPNGKSIMKSCSWDDSPGICRPAARHGRPPESRHILFGFRCVEKM